MRQYKEESFSEEEIISLFLHSYKNIRSDYNDSTILPIKEQTISIVSCDTMMQNTHFKLEWHAPDKLAKKLFHINLSDLVASGGEPEWCLLQIGIPDSIKKEFLKNFSISFLKECKKYQCNLIGGDTFYAERLVLSLTMGGSAMRYIQRKANPGDWIYVTGNFGLSLLGYKILNQEIEIPENLKKIALRKHLSPIARIHWAKELYPYASAMMDVSDGLIWDLPAMAKITGYQFQIDTEKIPVHDKFRKIIKVNDALISGEEYELIITSREKLPFPFLHQIGIVSKTRINRKVPPVRYFHHSKEWFPSGGYKHF